MSRVHRSMDTADRSVRATVLVALLLPVLAFIPAFAFGDAAGVSSLLKMAAKGDAAAQVELAGLYRSGQGVPRDPKEAAKWYLLAAQKGNLEAQSYLGFAYEKGQGVRRDYTEAAKWYRLAAEKGDLQAQRYMGFACRTGQGVPKDLFESAKWYWKAESQKWKK